VAQGEGDSNAIYCRCPAPPRWRSKSEGEPRILSTRPPSAVKSGYTRCTITEV